MLRLQHSSIGMKAQPSEKRFVSKRSPRSPADLVDKGLDCCECLRVVSVPTEPGIDPPCRGGIHIVRLLRLALLGDER